MPSLLKNINTIIHNEGWKDGEAGFTDAHGVFKINDITLVVPPTQISIRKEDLAWQWKTLRSKVSTKVQSGQGMAQVSLNLVFTPPQLLELHRLIVQFKHSPFCWIENDFIREAIVPQWPLYQQMAFTMVAINVSSMKGHPSSFVCELDLRWFNYFPYTPNFLYREEWITKSVTDYAQHKSESIAHYNSMQAEGLVPSVFHRYSGEGWSEGKYLDATQLGVMAEDYSIVDTNQQNIYGQDIKGRKTIERMLETHTGGVFDTMPLPQNMVPSQAVHNPALSRIYVRYINRIQQKALWESFDIDVYEEIESLQKGAWVEYWKGTWVHEAAKATGAPPKGPVRGLHNIPEIARMRIVDKMQQTMDHTTFTYHQYKVFNYSQEILDQIKEEKRKEKKEENTSASAERNAALAEVSTGRAHANIFSKNQPPAVWTGKKSGRDW